MMEKIKLLSHQKLYWMLLFVLGLGLEASALFYRSEEHTSELQSR